jgi:hypothetical protein
MVRCTIDVSPLFFYTPRALCFVLCFAEPSIIVTSSRFHKVLAACKASPSPGENLRVGAFHLHHLLVLPNKLVTKGMSVPFPRYICI